MIRAGESPRIHRETFYKMMAFLCEEDRLLFIKIIFHAYILPHIFSITLNNLSVTMRLRTLVCVMKDVACEYSTK